MIRCAVFDFDNTLVKSEAIKLQCFFDIVKDIENGEEIMKEIFNNPDRGDRFGIFRLFANAIEKENEEKAEELFKELSKEYSSMVERRVSVCTEIPGAKKALHDLQENEIELYINSATPERSLRKTVLMRGWGELFEDILGRPKSKVDNLEKISASSGFSPAEIVMVGDGDNDRQAAEAFGCDFIGLDFGNFKTPINKKAKNMHEVANFILQKK